MRPDPMIPDTHDHCRATHRLRVRAREAEAQIDEARAETAAVYAEMRALRAAIRDERAALTEFIESAEWERDLLCLARDRVRAELLALSSARKSCGDCGGFGRGVYEGLFTDAIEAIAREHRLPPIDAPTPINWPVRMGHATRQGRALRDDWLRVPARRRPAAERNW